MPRNQHPGRLLSRLLFLSLLGYAFAALRGDVSPTRRQSDERSFSPPLEPADPRPKPAKRYSRPRRVALGTVMTLVFFAGAAFTAGAGNQIASALDSTQSQSSDAPAATSAGGETSDSEPATGAAATPTAAPAPDAAAPAADPNAAPAAAPAAAPDASAPDSSASPDSSAAPTSSSDSSSPSTDDPVAGSGSGASAQASSPTASASVPANAVPTQSAAPTAPTTPHAKKARVQLPYVLPKQRPSRPTPRKRNPTRAPVVRASARQEASESPSLAPVVWLNRVLPDPTPPARRLDARFAKRLGRIARQSHVDWALMLGVLRAQGASSSVPATPGQLRALAAQLAAYRDRDAWNAVLAVTGLTSTADQAVALEHYDRAVGLRALVDGLQAHYDDLVAKVLNDGRITIYAGGRNDLASKRVNIRVVVLMEYLAETFGQETVSCLLSGHRLYARPGVVSAHIYGLAVDIADLGGVSIYGHQEPGGLTEKAVRSILLLPAELQPKQVISLLGLGGPSFPLADHFDHIHVGY
jgi:hypothetical protein